jgi:glucose-6-phosphate 1-dehydrogenase
MAACTSDALVFLGATGDLAYKKIFPSLQAMVKRGNLKGPVVGVAKDDWTIEQFRARARDSIQKHSTLDEAAFTKLSGMLEYVGGDYNNLATFTKLRKVLGTAQHPTHYLAIPPVLFATVTEQLGKSNCATGARVIIEKPFGRDLASAIALNKTILEYFDESSIFRIDHYLGKTAVQNLLFFRFSNAILEDFGVQGRGAFYEEAGAIRDVIQNHLLQIVAHLAMEPPAGPDAESIRDEKVKVLKSIPPLNPDDLVRGQFKGYRDEKGVAPNSQVETYAALRLVINSWRWKGVPFYIRAGKNMPVTCTEVQVRFRQPPAIYSATPPPANYFRFRISPDVVLALGAQVLDDGVDMKGEPVELMATDNPRTGEMEPYERLLTDAMKGDASLFAREDSVEQAWRIVDPVLKAGTPLFEYQLNTWGPQAEVEKKIKPCGGWQNPIMNGESAK